MFSRIIVPLDGTAEAEAALTDAVALATRFGATVHLVRAVPVRLGSLDEALREGGYVPGPLSDLDNVERESKTATEYLQQIAARVSGQNVPVSIEVTKGSIPESIATIAHSEPDSMIVMAAHSRPGHSEGPLGEVAEVVLRRSDRPVLVIKGS